MPGRIYRFCCICAVTLGLVVTVAGCTSRLAEPPPGKSDAYLIATLVPGGPMHGAKGIEFGPDGKLYVCTVYAESIYRVDVDTGTVEIAVAAPHGEADDIAFGPDGMMAWTALASAELRAQRPGGEPFVLADRLPLINPVGFTPDGRLFAAQIGLDRFLEIDVTGKEQPRLVAKGIGHLNSFEIISDNKLYGPLAGAGTVASIDLITGAVTPIAAGLDTISAVNLDSQGRIYAVGWDTGELLRIDAATGEHEVIAKVDAPVDNLAIDADDNIFLSLPARGAIIRVEPETGTQTEIIPGSMGIPGGLTIAMVDGRETLVIADDYAFRHADPATGRLWSTVNLAEFMDTSTASDITASDDYYVISDLRRSLVYSVNRKTGEKQHNWKRIAQPYGVAILDSGEVLVAEFESGQILKLNREKTRERNIFADNLNGPVGLVRSGNFLFVTEAKGGNIIEIDIESGARSVIATGLVQPEGITRMVNGNLAVVEVGRQRVVEINPVSGDVSVLAYDLPVGRESPRENDPVFVPSGIAAGADGSLYLSSDRQLSILKLTPIG